MTIELALLVGVIAVGTALGFAKRWYDGRMRTTTGAGSMASRGMDLAGELGAPLGERATLVQFSSAFCAPCRATRIVLSSIADRVPGVAHIEIDAESRLELVRDLDVRRTPTVFILDAGGQIVVRASGAPRRADVLAVLVSMGLDSIVEAPDGSKVG